MTTFDRYLLRRYAHAFGILFLSTWGLYVVIDGFTNVDGFQEAAAGGGDLLRRMAQHYTFHASFFFELAAPLVAVIAAMVVLGLLARSNVIHPLLAAGVPTYRLAVPLLIGVATVNGLLVLNQEMVIPRIAHRLQMPRGKAKSQGRKVDPIYDYATGIRIDGAKLYLDGRRMVRANFVLPAPEIVQEVATLQAPKAIHQQRTPNQPAGWLLRNVSPEYEEIELTERGRNFVRPQGKSGDVLIVTDVGFAEMYSRGASTQFLATAELIRRIKNPAFAVRSARGQSLELHSRLLAPLGNLLAVLVAVPLVIRRERHSLILNLALCTAVLALLFGVAQGFLYLGRANILSPELAVWGPIIFTGGLATWLSGTVRT